ncbi:MAG TPA: DUF6789 family protein [Vicinamibacterales bacterium]|jgi:hypothetical protein
MKFELTRIRWKAKRSSVFRTFGVSFLASGAALTVHIMSGVSLRLAIVASISLVALVTGWIWRRASTEDRSQLNRRVRAGLIAGAVATASYDVAKFALSQLDPSPYNPFEAIRIFGGLLTQSSMPGVVLYGAGTVFHLLNGISFGIAFCLLFRQPGPLKGIAWGMFLEIFQLTLFPGWLDIRFYREFVQISALSHVVYGMVLGVSCRYGMKHRATRVEAAL